MVIVMVIPFRGSSEIRSDLVSLPPLAARAFSEPSPSPRSNTPTKGRKWPLAEFSEKAEPFYCSGVHLPSCIFSRSMYVVYVLAEKGSLFFIAAHVK